MGSDESHLNVSLTVRDKVTRQCPQTQTFLFFFFFSFLFLKRKESRGGIEPVDDDEVLLYVHGNRRFNRDVHLNFHTVPEL